MEVDESLLALLPDAARKLARSSRRMLETEHGQWAVQVCRPPKEVERFVPSGAVVLANNGYGDFLFLQPGPEPNRQLSPVTYVYWHEGPSIEVFSPDLQNLIDFPEKPSSAQAFYADGLPVMLDDRVELRVWIKLFRKLPGTVVYVPGLSKRRTQMEHGGLTWVGIRMDHGGAVVGSLVDPETGYLQKKVRLLGRGERVNAEVANPDEGESGVQ
jgi:hypothetical protein